MSWRAARSRGGPPRRPISNAKNRLLKEAQELAINPVENCNAVPLENNIFEWHANISTPLYEGVCFHFIITFTDKYPKVAPKVKPCQYIKHPNVFGDYICLDILTMSEETETTPYRGWTSAYSVRSLLVQLQCFLFDLTNQPSYNAINDRQYDEARSCTCSKCGHWGTKPFPAINQAQRESGFYKLRRLALVRKEADLKSPEVCQLERGMMVQVVGFDGRRARLNLSYHPEAKGESYGYCSVYTSKGVLLKSVLSNQGSGEYKAMRKVNVKKLDGTDLFELDKHEQVTVETLLPHKKKVYAKLSAIPGRHRSLSMNMDDLYVNATELRLIKKHVEETKEVVLHSESYWLHEFYGPVLDIVLSMLDADTVNNISLCHDDLKLKVDTSQILLMRNYRCFYTLKTIRDDDCVIGFGIKTDIMDKVSRHKMERGRGGRVRGTRRPVLQRLHPSFDYMTYEAFDQYKCKTNVWKDCVFDAFLPLFINKTHGAAALPLAEKCILAMWKKENPRNQLTCERVLETLAKLMNTTVVNMNKCVDDVEVEEIQLFDSIKALEGYMAFHHLLLAFAMKYPQLVEIANKKIRDFCKNEHIRDKEITPDIGELIVYLSISKYSWQKFYPGFARELFDRNVRWILAKYPGLRQIEPDNLRSCVRLAQSFSATKTGKRLAAFQCFFMNEIACPLELQGNPDKVSILFKEYNGRLGKPVVGMAERLQIHSRKVLAMSNWFDYFELVSFAAPTAIELCDWLRQSITRSAAKKYHNIDKILRYNEHHIEGPNYIKHKNPFLCSCAGGQVFNLKDATSIDTCKLVSKPKERIDIAFVVDCTGSMGSWLSQAKKSIQQTIRDINRKTQFKKVRFALVPYRDHSPGEGPNGYVVKKFEFTSDLQRMQKNVDTLQAGGGADAPEAMSCGLATAAGLSWNREAMQLLIHIGDEKPHGISCSGGDNYPNGCPDGHDALRVAHNLAKKGIPIYNVYCGHGDSLTETFYHAMSHITNGQCLQLKDASTLSNIVLGAAMEEQTMNKISQKIMPIWEHVHERHPHARGDQIIYELYQRLKADKFQVKTVLGGRQLCKSAMKSIETIAFCMDIKQVKAMQEKGGEYFYSFSRGDGQITKETTKLIDEGQVRKWYKRNKKIMAIAEFKKNGCQYAQSRWQPAASAERLRSAELARFGTRQAIPWAKVNMRNARKIFDDAGKIVKAGGKPATPLTRPAGGEAAKPPAKKAWGDKSTSSSPKSQTTPAPAVPPRNVAPAVQPRNVAPAPAVQHRNVAPAPAAQPRNVAPAPAVQPRNVAPAPAVQHRNVGPAPAVQPRNVAPAPTVQPRNVTPAPTVQPRNVAPGAVQPRYAAPGPARSLASTFAQPRNASWGNTSRAPTPMGPAGAMSRNTSYTVNNITSASESSASNFPGRGAPIQTIRGSRSNSATRGRAPIQSIRRSRSNSREPQRSAVSRTSAPPTTNSSARAGMSRPPSAYPATSSPSSSGSATSYARTTVVKFDSKHIITDYLNARYKWAGVNAPTKIQVENGCAYVTFASSHDAEQASHSRVCYDNGIPMEFSTVEQHRQTKV